MPIFEPKMELCNNIFNNFSYLNYYLQKENSARTLCALGKNLDVRKEQKTLIQSHTHFTKISEICIISLNS